MATVATIKQKYEDMIAEITADTINALKEEIDSFEALLLNFFNNLEYIMEDPKQALYLEDWVKKRRKEILGVED